MSSALSPAARALLERRAAARSPAVRIPPRDAAGAAPASSIQQRLWLFEQLHAGTTIYHNQVLVHLRGPLERDALERALALVVRRHEPLRTALVPGAGTDALEQRVLDVALALPVDDLRTLGPDEQAARARLLVGADRRSPFDLAAAPPLRARLLLLGPERHLLSLVLHHTAADGWGRTALLRELDRAYGALVEGRTPDLAELPLRYGDYAAWERAQHGGEAARRALEHWREALADVDLRLALPVDRARPARTVRPAGRLELELDAELVAALRALARQESATLFMALLAGLQALLARWSRQDRFLVGVPVTGRTQVETEPLVGCFIHTLAIPADTGGQPSFRELLGRVRHATAHAHAHQAVPFERVMELLRPAGAGAMPLQVLFNYRSFPEPPTALGPLAAEVETVWSERTVFDLDLEVEERDGAIVGALCYDADAFAPETAGRLVDQWRRLLAGAAAAPDRPVTAVALMDEAERRMLLDDWNRTDRPWPDAVGVHELVAARAAELPAVEAVVSDGETLTRAELQRRARALAAELRALGVGPGARVGVCLQRTPTMVASLLAILEAGAAYVPLDPDYPLDRLAFMCEDARLALVLTQDALADRLPAGVRTLRMDRWSPRDEPAPLAPDADPARADRVAYVIYTSGSTGRPKGVEITHRSLANLCDGLPAAYGVGEGDRYLQFCALSFDISVEEIFGALVPGATVVLRTEAMARSAEEFCRGCERFGVTVVDIPTAFWHELAFALDGGAARLPPSMRIVLVGGERLLPEAVAAWRRAVGASVRLCNGYGPTETTVIATVYEIPAAWTADDLLRPVPIGTPVPNTRCYVLDAQGEPVPIGTPGELWIGGGGVARGYLDRPELTAERFRSDPFAGATGARMYRSGDLVRWRADGVLEFLGRTDEQVKLRGYRIELGEVEAAIGGCAGVGEVAALVRDDGHGPRLVAYWTPVPGAAEPAELEAQLRARLPAFMLPALVRLDTLPRTPGGKLDRRVLPAPDAPARTPGVAPRDLLEADIAQVWEEVLGLRGIGVHDDFFALGGHSLLAMRVMARLARVLPVASPVRALFDAPTIARLADAVRAAGPDPDPRPPIEPSGSIEGPLAFTQEAVWLLESAWSDLGSAYVIADAWRLRGPLDAAALSQALDRLVDRHPALRTAIDDRGGEAVQRILPSCPVPLALLDLADIRPAERECRLRDAIETFARRPFALERELPIRGLLVALGPGEQVLALAWHHLAFDGWSRGLFYQELDRLYRGERPPAPAVRYLDFARWQRTRLSGDALARRIAAVGERLRGAAPVHLPLDRPRPLRPGHAGGSAALPLAPETVDALRALAQRHGVTLQMLLLALFETLLHRYSGQDDLVIGLPTAGRAAPGVEDVIGFFATTVAVRTDLSGDPTFSELLGRVRASCLAAYQDEGPPVEARLLQVFFAHEAFDDAALALAGVEVERLPVETLTAKADLTLFARERAAGADLVLHWRSELMAPATAQALLDGFATLAAVAVRGAEQPLSRLALVSGERRDALLAWGRNTARPLPAATVPALVREVASRRPDAVAVTDGTAALTYGDLMRRSAALAARLRAAGAAPGSRVGVLVERSADLIVALLAVLRCGAAYVPLDSAYPAERLATMAADGRLVACVGREGERGDAPADVPFVPVDGPEPDAVEAAAFVDAEVATDAPAYVIYTSGSTGAPKGVIVTHRGIVRLARETDYVRLGPDDVVAQASNAAFDAATFEIWGALLNGARLAVLPTGTVLDPGQLREALSQERVTVLFLTTALFNLVARTAPDAFHPLRTVMFGGERADAGAVRAVLAAGGPARLVHVYGPTEVTTFALWHEVAEVPADATSIPIGRPIANTTAYVLDRHLEPVPPGAVGELVLGGPGVALGYLHRDELTAERFLPDRFGIEGDGAERLYRTGDLVRLRADGALEFVGRADRQIKLRGYRIEPGEIEAVLAAVPGVEGAAVELRDDGAGPALVAYVAGPDTPGDDAIRQALRRTLPDYMTPAAVVRLGALPLTPNGKVDRARLPAPAAASAPARATRPPDSPLEYQLIEILRALLPGREIGAEDDFFELGGHSLLAARLVTELERRTGVRLPASTVVEFRTVERLAQRAVAAERGLHPSRLTVVQEGGRGGGTPVFFCHGDSTGAGVYCLSVAHAIGADVPFYSLAPHTDDRPGSPLTIEAMADDYLRLVRTTQPRGPYRLGGYCNGGVVAFEMARRLEQAGERVELLLLVDAGVRNVDIRRWVRPIRLLAGLRRPARGEGVELAARWLDRVREWDRRSRRFRRASLPAQVGKAGGVLGRGLRAIAGSAAAAPAAAPVERDLAWTRWRRTMDLMARALSAYVPGRYSGRVDLLWARSESAPDEDASLGWRHFAADVRVETAAVHHHAIVTTHLPDLLRRRLDELSAPPPAAPPPTDARAAAARDGY